MDLQQEYYTRSGCNYPLICYVDKGFLFLKNKNYKRGNDLPKIIAMSISWTNKPDTQPGAFKVSMMCPVHDGCNHPLKQYWEKRVEWDEWESFIKSWVRDNPFAIPVSEAEATHVMWQIFAKANDGWLAGNLPPLLQDGLFTLLTQTDSGDRPAIIKEIESFVKSKNTSIYQSLMALTVNCSPDQYASWLIKLFNVGQ
jgi:hypothetical protein